ncbi:helix-turn-helix domain-containing protein [Enterococcus casseliflavus]|uniref:helix-turn-helix domain-containing protein n=1 Tax=Enterococcus casseliflavus TaxID=37734 RepID=UPI0012E21DF0|nr:helix-turn-helix domain-containing protein [Enterococcus casseliflavus]MUN74778.1 M protein trans-acting positive regulator [Enterococcus casseliflavus]MUN97613.1 M protein trans-acting positive regulator [Enterococcus casseliflavus]
MYKEDLLDKDLKLEYILLKFLYLSTGHIKKSDACRELEITMPTLTKLSENLQQQLKNEKVSFAINRYTLDLQVNDSVSLDDLTDTLLKKSVKYQIIHYLFQHAGYDAFVLADELKISVGTLNRVIAECNQLLQHFELKIKNKKLAGTMTQRIYFYYNFLKMGETAIDSVLIDELVAELAKKITLSIAQQKQLKIWLFVIMKKVTPHTTVGSLSPEEQIKINRCQEMPICRFTRQAYVSKKSICSVDEAKIVPFFICLFLVTVGGIPYEELRLGLYTNKNPVFEITDEVMAAIQSIYCLEASHTTIDIKASVFSLIAQVYYFHGVNYSIDRVTLNYYHKLFHNSLRDQVITDILQHIIAPTNLFTPTKLNYLKKRLVFLIYLLSPKEEYRVRIGVLNMGSSLLADASIYLLKNELKGKQNVTISPYNNEEEYDLLISNARVPQLGNNYGQFYQVTAIGADLDVNQVSAIVDQIAYSKYHSFVV